MYFMFLLVRIPRSLTSFFLSFFFGGGGGEAREGCSYTQTCAKK